MTEMNELIARLEKENRELRVERDALLRKFHAHDIPDDDPRWVEWAAQDGLPTEDYRNLMRAYGYTYDLETGEMAVLVAGDQGYETVSCFVMRGVPNTSNR